MASVTPSNVLRAPTVPVAGRVGNFSYAIRNIVVEAQQVEASGTRVRYLNVGNPPPFGFQPPPHMVEAVIRAMRDGENGYCPSPGIAPAREAVAAEYSRRAWPMTADRVLITAGTSEATVTGDGAPASAPPRGLATGWRGVLGGWATRRGAGLLRWIPSRAPPGRGLPTAPSRRTPASLNPRVCALAAADAKAEIR